MGPESSLMNRPDQHLCGEMRPRPSLMAAAGNEAEDNGRGALKDDAGGGEVGSHPDKPTF